MSLIYLDNSQLNLLEETLRDRPDRFSLFLERWKALEHTLAISSTHAEEIALSSLPDARERRYRVIRTMLPVRTSLPLPEIPRLHHAPLVHRELVLAVASRVGRSELLEGKDRYWVGFPSTGDETTLTLSALLFESPQIRGIIGSSHLAHDSATLAKHRSPTEKRKRQRMRDLDNGPIPQHVIAHKMAEFDRSFAEEKEKFIRQFGLPRELFQAAWVAQRNAILGFLQKAQTLGYRRGYAEHLGFELEAVQDEYVDVLIAKYTLREELRNCTETYLNTDRSAADDIARSLTFGDCPGYWLRHLVDQEIQDGEDTPPVSNEYDLAHLANLPYVDAFFCDKRISNYVRQLHRRFPDLEIWRCCSSPVSVAKSMSALEDALTGGPTPWE